ncbi:MAG: carboxypeptidase regulatory-like domain-containing protein [Acidobacteriota bacterium]
MRQWVLVVGLLCLAGTPVLAQQNFSELRGRVTDAQGAALPGVAIVARHQESGLFRETVSGSDGAFFMTAMNPGPYTVSAELSGFQPSQRTVALLVGRTATLDIQMQIGTFQEAVTVTGEAPLVDLSSKEIGGHVNAQELADTLSFNRNFTSYLGLLPGVVASISTASFGADSINVNGQTVRNVNYMLDGANNNDTFNGGNGGAQARVPVESVQEFQLLTSQFDAEYGSTSGGVVNAVSKQGTNRFRGSAFTFFQNDAMTTRDFFARQNDLEKPETRQLQWGGTLGGPIVRDKAHFFYSGERIAFDQGVTVNIPARPEFNRTDFEETRVWNHLVRFDHQLTSNHTWGGRLLWETSPQANQLDTDWTASRAEKETDTDWTFVANLNSVLSSTTVNTLRVSVVREDVFFGNPQYFEAGSQVSLPPLLDYLSFQDQQSTRATSRLDTAYGLDDTFSWFIPNRRGDHDVKAGFQYLYSNVRRFVASNTNGTFIFSHDLAFDLADPRTYPERLSIRVPGAQDFLSKAHFFSAFIQDKWKITERLGLSLGLRYDLEVMPIDERDNPRFSDRSAYPVDRNNVAPRVGVTWAADAERRSVVRGGFGLFFQRTPFTFTDAVTSSGVFTDSFTVLFPATGVDAGPSRGVLPTDPFLVGGPTVNRTLLNALFPRGTLQRNAGDVFFDSPDRKLPYARQYSIGYERQIGTNMSASVDYIRSEQRDLHMRRNLNAPVRATTSRTGRLVRPNPDFVQNVWEIGNYGYIDYDALQFEFNRRYSRGFALRGSYTLSKGRGNNEVANNEIIITQVEDALNLDRNVGPTSIDRRHVMSANATWLVPRTGGLQLSGVVQYRSGTPITLINSSFDLNRNGRFEDEFLPAGTYRGTGPNALTVENTGGRRGARGPDYAMANVRAGYNIPLQSNRRVQVFLDVFNLTNRTNFNNPSGDQRSSTFLVPTSINEAPRTVQLNFRIEF